MAWSNFSKSLLLYFVLASSFAFSQGGSFVRQVSASTVSNGGTGQVIPYANVLVCSYPATGTPCTPLANIYADRGLTQPLSNPFAADINGLYSFFVATGEYLVQETTPVGAGYTFAESFSIFSNGTGTVSVVNLSLPSSLFLTTGSPCTTVCDLSASLIAQSPYTVFGNFGGSSAVPSFGSLVAGQIPSTLNATTIDGLAVSGNETVSGTLGVTGNTTLSGTLNVTGLTTLGSLSVTGNETVSGTATLSDGGSLSGTFSGNPAFSGIPVFGTLNVLTGIEIGGSFGTAGACLQSTGSGSIYSVGCGLGGTPTVSAESGSGGGTATLTTGSLDKIGQVTVVAGGAALSSSELFLVTFSTPFSTAAFCNVTPADSPAATLGTTYVGVPLLGSGLAEFAVYSTGTVGSGTTYVYNYGCNGQ
jgi:hypothetical protein